MPSSESTPRSPRGPARGGGGGGAGAGVAEAASPSACCGCLGGSAQRHELAEFAEYELLDAHTRRATTLAALSRDTPLVLVFLRRLGCQLCRLRASEFEAARPAIAQAGAACVCVSFEFPGEGSDRDRSWQRVGAWRGALLADPSRTLYRALFRRKTFGDKLWGLLDLSTARMNESTARGFGKDANLAGDGLMLGGCFVLDAGGRVLLDQRSQFFGDDVPIAYVLSALRRAKGARVLPPGEKLVQIGEWRHDEKAPTEKACATPACML
jgi:peroxiredoxin